MTATKTPPAAAQAAPAALEDQRLPGVLISDEQFEAHKASLNNCIHELVMACQFMEQGGPDDLDSATQCLLTAQGTIDRVNEDLVEKRNAAQDAGNPTEESR